VLHARGSEDLYGEVEEAVLPRLRDSNLSVRVQAIEALSRLQDPSNIENQVTAEYLRIADHDASKYVVDLFFVADLVSIDDLIDRECRLAVVQTLSISSQSIPILLRRVRDIVPSIRIASYHCLRDKVSLKWLTIQQRVRLLKDGLNDRYVNHHIFNLGNVDASHGVLVTTKIVMTLYERHVYQWSQNHGYQSIMVISYH
jgi:condensin complex subunit 3